MLLLFIERSFHKLLEGVMAEEKPAGEKLLDALKKSGLKVGKPIKVRQTKESKKHWAAIENFCKQIAFAHKNTAKSTLRFRTAL